MTGVVDIAVGRYHSAALKSDGTVVAWGDNRSGQCDVPANLPSLIEITAGGKHTFVLTEKGKTISWGYLEDDWVNYMPPDIIKPLIDIDTGYGYIIGIQNDNSFVGWGRAEFGEIHILDEIKGVVSISTGIGLSLALKKDGTVTVIGGGLFKLTEYAEVLTDINYVAAGTSIAAAIRNDGKLIIWGYKANKYKNEALDNLIIFDGTDY